MNETDALKELIYQLVSCPDACQGCQIDHEAGVLLVEARSRAAAIRERVRALEAALRGLIDGVVEFAEDEFVEDWLPLERARNALEGA